VREHPANSSPEEEPTLGDTLWMLVDEWRTIAGTLSGVLVLSALYLVLAKPTYRSDVLLQVEDKSHALPGLDDLQTLFSDKSVADTEVEIIRSRGLTGAVVDQLNLTIIAEPRRFPIVGTPFVRFFRDDDDGLSPPVLGLGSFAWGGELISVTRLDVPDALLDRRLALVAGAAGRYDLLGPKGETILTGEVGKAASAPVLKGNVSLFVQQLQARPGTHFRIIKRRRADVIDDLQEDLRIQERGKKTGILEVSLDGKDATKTAAILDTIAQDYLRQNVDRKSAEAAASLEFLEEQLPALKKNLDRSEAVLNAYQLKHGTVDLSMETQALLDRAAEIEKAISELELSRSELRQRFTEHHPALLSVQEKSAKLRNERTALESRMRTLPEQEVTSVRLMRDVKVASELYFTLINKAEELRIIKSGTIGNVRILDAALLPYEPQSPKPLLVIGLAVFLGLAGGIGLAVARRALDQALKDPAEIEARTGLAIFASVPHSDRQGQLVQRRAASGRTSVLAVDDPADLAIESVRSLRTSLQFSLADANSNVITIGGPSPSVGKTFVSINLAYVLANTGKRVLLIDADMRRGKLHRHTGGDRAPGLSELLTGQTTLAEAARGMERDGLSLITTGTLPPNPSELLGSPRFQALLDEASRRYDFVLVDVPPILAVTDAALVARIAGVNLLVLRAGCHPAREIIAAHKALANAGARVNGAVINDVHASAATRYGRYGYRYHYHYDYTSPGGEDA
jgi:tyrosine-protein kinase Etk/Wzc